MLQRSVENLDLTDLFSQSTDGIFLLDDDCNVLSWNLKMERLTQTSAKNAIGKSIFKIADQFLLEPFIEPLKLALNNKSLVAQNTLKFKTAEQRTILQASFSPFRLPNEEGLGCMVILREVNSSSLRSKFKPLVEESPIATAIFDINGDAKYFNKAYGKIWGVESGIAQEAMKFYNILEDEQLKELGIISHIQKAFNGESCDLPPIAYNPFDTLALKGFGINIKRYIEGHLYPIMSDNGDLEEVVVVLSDITFRHHAEQILSDNQKKYERLTEGLPGVIYEYEEAGNNPDTFRYISQGCEEIFGFTPEQILDNANLLRECIHPGDALSYNLSISQTVRKSSVWEWKGRILNNEKIKWIKGKSSATKLDDGSIVRYGLLLDITDQKEIEDQYKLSEERLNIALHGADLGLWEWNITDGKFLHNNSWAKKLGYTFEDFNELLADRLSLIHPEDVEYYKEKTDEMILSMVDMVEVDYRMKTKSGDWLWVRDRGRVLTRTEDGLLKKVSGTLLDIENLKQSQKLIKQNEQLFTQLFENAPMGLVLLDETHRVVQMNEGFQNIFGYSKDEIIGHQLNNIIVPSDNLKEALDINTLTSSGEVGILESYRIHKDGSKIPVIIYGVPVSFNERTLGIYGIYVNITDRVEAEKELQIRNNELDNFVYKVSHDLRAPLSSVLGLVNLANLEQNEDDIKEYIGLIENRVRQLDSFITDVLSHSKNLKMEVQLDKIDFKNIISECFNELSYLPNSTNVLRKIAIDDQEFHSDIWRIKEVFRNLISNSVKYSDSKKSTSYVSIDIKIDAESAHIRVEDNGIGVEKDALSKVFDMFYRATTEAEGSGIGLYIVHNAITKLGGQVRIESKANEGTTFDIILPNQIKNPHI